AFERAEPAVGHISVGGGWGDVDGGRGAGESLDERATTHGERFPRLVPASLGEEVERHEVRGGPSGEQPDSAVGRVDPLLESLEVETSTRGVRDDDLAVHAASLREVRPDRVDDLREVPGHRPLVAAADLDLGSIAEDDGAESVPLRLEAEWTGRDVLDRLGEHG